MAPRGVITLFFACTIWVSAASETQVQDEVCKNGEACINEHGAPEESILLQDRLKQDIHPHRTQTTAGVCCWSAWGGPCGNYDGSGGHCAPDFTQSCNGDGDCSSSPPGPTPSTTQPPTPSPTRPLPRPTPSPTKQTPRRRRAPTHSPTNSPTPRRRTPAPSNSPTLAPTLPPTNPPAPSGGCERQSFSWSGHSWTGLGCTFEAVAKAWVEAGGSKNDCAETMAIVLGEGVNPSCKGSDMKECVQTTHGFPLDIPPYDNQCTLGPWQVLSTKDYVDSPVERAQEAIAYMQTNCGTKTGVVSGCGSAQCQKVGSHFPSCHDATMVNGGCLCAYCPTTIDAQCSKGWTITPTTIFTTSVGQFCGCKSTDTYTTGWSGRCSNHNTANYQNELPLARELCAKVNW